MIPERQYLASQALELLRRQISSGEWGEFMPPERDLAQRMKVGRNTLRQALTVLEQEGWIEPGHVGRRRRILGSGGAGEAPAPKRVILLTPYDPLRLPTYLLRETDHLRRAFNEAGYRLDPMTSKAFRVERCERILERLVHLESAGLWILQNAPMPIQQWFDQQDIPAMVVGYSYPGIDLPFVTEDVVAAARHAVGRLSTRGHKRLALLQPSSVLAGHSLVRTGMEEICAREQMELRQVQHDGTRDGLCRKLDALLASEFRPTALIMVYTFDVITAMTHLARRGCLVPADMSLVSLFDDSSLDAVVPEVTRYRINADHFMRQVFMMAGSLVGARGHTYEPVHLQPEMIRGETLGQARR